MAKRAATDQTVRGFLAAVFPDAPELALLAFDEEHVLKTATELLRGRQQALLDAADHIDRNGSTFYKPGRATAYLRELAGAPDLGRQQAEQPVLNVSELREGEENDGPLQSTDLHLEGRGISLLCNVTAGQRFTYSLIVDGNKVESGTVGASAPDRVQQAEQARDEAFSRVVSQAASLVQLHDQIAALTQALKDVQMALLASSKHVPASVLKIIDAALTGAQA